MAKSLCIVTLLMIFILISSGIPKGKAQCDGVLNSGTPPGICTLGVGRTVCHNSCTGRGFIRGDCETQADGITTVCNCYRC
ncbi:hypothetical protein Bca4012_021786 [Brassica carinata]